MGRMNAVRALGLVIGLAVAAGSAYGAFAEAAPGAGSAGAPARVVEPPRFEGPDGFCPVEPARSENHAKLWQAFTPPPQRGSRLLAFRVDCPTLREVETRGPMRPRMILSLVDTPRDPQLPTSQDGVLDALLKRFSQPDLAAKAPVLGRDVRAVYVEQRVPADDRGPGLSGVSAFTWRSGEVLVLNIIHFGGSTPVAEIRDQAARAVTSLHRTSR